MKIKREKVLILNNILRQVSRIFKAPISGKFYYTVTRNHQIAEEERKLCFEAYPMDQKYIEYDQKRQAIYLKEGIKNDAQLNEVAMKDAVKFNAIQESQRKLAEEYKDAIDAERQMAATRQEFFDEDIEIDIRTVSGDELPEIDPDAGLNSWNVFMNIEPMVKFAHPTVTKTVTREQLINLDPILQRAGLIFAGNVSSKFYAAVRHNMEITANEERLCYEAYPVDSKFNEYEALRHSIFNEEGIFSDNQLTALAKSNLEKYKAIQNRQRKLAEEYKDVIAAEKAIAVERDKYTAEEVTVDLQMVSIDDVPELNNNPNLNINYCEVFNSLSPMVDLGDEPQSKE